MILSIIICTRDRHNLLLLSVESVLGQVENSCELLIVDNGDGSLCAREYEILKDERIKLYHHPVAGLSRARNLGIKKAQGEFVFFLDDDATLGKDCLKNILSIIKEQKAVVFGGKIVADFWMGRPVWLKNEYESLDIGNQQKVLNKIEFLYGSNIIIKKNLFGSIGNFNFKFGLVKTSGILGEEIDWQQRAIKSEITRKYYPSIEVKHKVLKEKLNLSYQVKRRILSIKTNYLLLHQNLSLISTASKALKQFFVILYRIFTFPIRDKKNWEYWQQYFLEEIIRRCEFLLCLGLKLVRYENKQ